MKKGFTLLETVIALGILITSTLLVYGMTVRIFSNIQEEKTKFVAAYLAQEGIEIVRNIRDVNWISGADDWDYGLGAGDYRVQYDSTSLLSYQDVPLKLNSSGFYNYDSGNTTQFKRKITLSHPATDIIKVVAEVSWSGRTSPVQAEEFFYNWY